MTINTLTPASIDNSKAVYLALRAEWKNRANSKANSAEDHLQYILTCALLLAPKLGDEATKAWAFRKLKAAFSPSNSYGHRTLERLLDHECRYGHKFGRPFQASADLPLLERRALRLTWEEAQADYRALAKHCLDQLKLEG